MELQKLTTMIVGEQTEVEAGPVKIVDPAFEPFPTLYTQISLEASSIS